MTFIVVSRRIFKRLVNWQALLAVVSKVGTRINSSHDQLIFKLHVIVYNVCN